MLDLWIVSRFCEMIRGMCEMGDVIQQRSTTDTDLLADSLGVDGLIKINHINFIEEKKSAEWDQAFQYFGMLYAFSSAVERWWWGGMFEAAFWQSSVHAAFPECHLFLLNASYRDICSVNAISQNDAAEISHGRLFGRCLPVWGTTLMGASWGLCFAEAFFSPSIFISALKCFLGLPTFALLSALWCEVKGKHVHQQKF